MVKCSLCNAEYQKQLCPLNPNAKNPNPKKHNIKSSPKPNSKSQLQEPTTLHKLLDNIKTLCPGESENISVLKSNINDKALNVTKKSP